MVGRILRVTLVSRIEAHKQGVTFDATSEFEVGARGVEEQVLDALAD
jgi:hypothetical protein